VMGHAGEFCLGRLGRANDHPAVKQQGVAGNDFRPVGLGPAQGQLGLPDSGATG